MFRNLRHVTYLIEATGLRTVNRKGKKIKENRTAERVPVSQLIALTTFPSVTKKRKPTCSELADETTQVISHS